MTRGARPALQLRRILVAAASAGTGFLLLCTLGYAMSHPDETTASLLRLAWCATPLAATVHFAVAVARTDPAARPRPGLSAIGLGPTRLMAVAATTTALSCTLGSLLALLFFLHLRGDLTGMPFDGAAAEFLAAKEPMPLPAALTLLTLTPAIASVTVGWVLRPQGVRAASTRTTARSYGGFGGYGNSAARETFGAYGRFGTRLRGAGGRPTQPATDRATQPAATRAAGTAPDPLRGGTPQTRASDTHHFPAPPLDTPAADPDPGTLPPPPQEAPRGLPWGIAVLAAGLAVEAYATRTATGTPLTMPGGLASTGPVSVLLGWILTATGLALAGPGLTHLCGHLLQTARPGALRLLAGRVLMAEATRIGRPLGVVCAVASGAYAMAALYDTAEPSFGPLTALGLLLVTGCTVATLLTAAVEAKHARADTTAALLRLGAPATVLRSAAALRAGALLSVFGPLTLIVAELAALPLAR
ncbi:membrane protein [Streptomyces sp. MMG1533]|nr:membrane protein [Streptomyces sp. MMG1533]